MIVPRLRLTNALPAALASKVGAVMFTAMIRRSTSGAVLKQAATQRNAGIVQQQGDRRVAGQAVLHACEVRGFGEIGRQHVYRAPGLGAERRRQGFEAAGIAGNQDEIVAAVGQPVGVDGADAGRCASDEGSALE